MVAVTAAAVGNVDYCTSQPQVERSSETAEFTRKMIGSVAATAVAITGTRDRERESEKKRE